MLSVGLLEAHMTKLILTTILCLWASAAGAFPGSFLATSVGGGSVQNYCATQSWSSLGDFKLDYDHPDGATTACVGEATFTITNDYSGTPTPTTTGIGSGGLAGVWNANNEYATFSNTSVIFTSQWGQIFGKIKVDGALVTSGTLIVDNVYNDSTDKLRIGVDANGKLYTQWEDNNAGAVTLLSVDVDTYYDKWIQFLVKWDTSKCTAGNGNCASPAEMCISYRVDNNADGDFADGGVESWSVSCETSTLDFTQFAAEPTTIQIGLKGTYQNLLEGDDFEISTDQPTF